MSLFGLGANDSHFRLRGGLTRSMDRILRRTGWKDMIRFVVPRTARNWLRSPSKSAMWVWDGAKFSLGITQSLQMAPNLGLVCHPHAYKVYRASQIFDSEQSAEFRNFLPHCSTSMTLFDVGAHFGIFSLAAARFGGRAVAIDPSHTATRMIEIQASLNGLSSAIEIVCAAVDDSAGSLDMVSSGVFSDGYFQGARGRSSRELTRVRAVTIDQLSQRYGAPTHIKIDVEGNEAAVLRGAKDVLSEHRPILFIELHNEMMIAEGRDPEAPLAALARHGYSTYTVRGAMIEKSAILHHPLIRIVASYP